MIYKNILYIPILKEFALEAPKVPQGGIILAGLSHRPLIELNLKALGQFASRTFC